MSVFSFDDYAQNPGKYRLFATARIAVDCLDGFEADDVVALRYHDSRPVMFYHGKPIDSLAPVYACKDRYGCKRYLFGPAFKDFVL